MPRASKNQSQNRQLDARRQALFWRQSLARLPVAARQAHLTYLLGAIQDIMTDFVPLLPDSDQGGTLRALTGMLKWLNAQITAAPPGSQKPHIVYAPELPKQTA